MERLTLPGWIVTLALLGAMLYSALTHEPRPAPEPPPLAPSKYSPNYSQLWPSTPSWAAVTELRR